MSVAARLEHIETKQPLVFDEVDFTMRDPHRLAVALADPLEYAQRVEALVATGGMELLMLRRDDDIERFLRVWTDDETSHARALDELMSQLGLEATSIDGMGPPWHARLIGAVGRASGALHDVITTIWATSGAMNEHLAMTAYHRIDTFLQEWDEQALHDTLFRRLRAHESAHKSFYSTYAAEMWARLAPWQRRLTAGTLQRVWAPVGAGAAVDKPAFARTVAALSRDDWQEQLVDPVQALAERIVADGDELPPFVRDAVVECLESDPAGRALLGTAP